MRPRIPAVALAVAAALPSLAAAVDFSYSGFSTAAYAQTDTDLAQVGYVGQPEGIDEDGSFKADSKLGVQVTARFNDMFSATVQGVAYTDLTSNWEPHLDWAYIKFQPVSNLSARVGYMRAPTFMFSDSVFIGYANSWIRTPMEVYNLTPVYQLRGADLLWRQSVGAVTVSVQPYYGDSELEAGDPATTVDVKEWYGLAASAEMGSFMVRAGYGRQKLDTVNAQLAGVIDQLRMLAGMGCAGCATDADGLDPTSSPYEYLDFGLQFDNGTNLAIVEYGKRESGQYVAPDMHSAYATYGHRFGSLMPYATYAIARRDGANASAIPDGSPFAAIAAAANATLASTGNDQDSYTLGLRYEVPSFSIVKGAIVKLQYDHIEAKEGNGLFINVQPGFEGETDMISASFDFIF
ncbi:MAG TPA: hypothetical protein PKE27_06220 [Povalibacter sp.]|uniref:hypothetical protein n=1 Tax=Povalibacter sp. TaxID=1962978 RepID=UPI002C81110A|nr:hypothetical protein [Povalibacter sp.]HMN44144.1 hypothetical protein [Povalibacter sp.]